MKSAKHYYLFTYLFIFLILISCNTEDNVKDDSQSRIATTPVRVNVDPMTSVTIGTQIWMKFNLNVDTYRNGNPIPQVQDQEQWTTLTTGAWCYYENMTANGPVYGKLYNWYAVNDPRGLAPQGWHVASDAEWTTLTTYLGGTSVAGAKLKAVSSLWASLSEATTNSSRFSALPGGTRFGGEGYFDYMNSSGYWWTSTQALTGYSWNRSMNGGGPFVQRINNGQKSAAAVRCIKD